MILIGIIVKEYASVSAETTKRRKPTLKQRVQIAAYAMFEERGISHVSVDAIAEAAETTKMGVYRQFSSKDALVEAWISDTIAAYRRILDDLEERFPDDPVAQLHGFAHHIVETLPAISDRGCPFVNTIAEVGDAKSPLIKRIMAHKARQAQRLTELCRKAQIPSPDQAAAHLTFVLEGAQITAQNGSVTGIPDFVMATVNDILGRSAEGPDPRQSTSL